MMQDENRANKENNRGLYSWDSSPDGRLRAQIEKRRQRKEPVGGDMLSNLTESKMDSENIDVSAFGLFVELYGSR